MGVGFFFFYAAVARCAACCACGGLSCGAVLANGPEDFGSARAALERVEVSLISFSRGLSDVSQHGVGEEGIACS